MSALMIKRARARLQLVRAHLCMDLHEIGRLGLHDSN